MTTSQDGWIALAPKLRANGRAAKVFLRFVTQIRDCDNDELEQIREKALTQADGCPEGGPELRVLVSILCDLRGKGWRFRIKNGQVMTAPPEKGEESVLEHKQRVRSYLLLERDAQLRTGAVRDFVQGMEQRRFGPEGWTSIFSVMRDGRDLAAKLRAARAVPDGPERHEALRRIIDPYLQFVDSEAVCSETGMRLADIWRYFRHTWTTPYSNAPGRRFWILVRDRAVKHHPVIGIAAFGNAVVQLGPRDRWIGWLPKVFIARLKGEASREWAEWLERSAAEMMDGVYIADFLQKKILTKKELKNPSDELVVKLERLAKAERKKHDMTPQAELHKFDDDMSEDQDWVARAETHLFKAKRAEALARVLQVVKGLKKAGFTSATKEKLLKVLDDVSGRRAIEIVLRNVKATRVGINLLEITICGAVPPYNAVLGGKLVAMLLTSPEVVLEYERKYGKAFSVIASSMAGRPVRRRPNLVALGTTSLYGAGSAMYNRIAIPAEVVGGNAGEVVRYQELGKSEGFGSIHFSTATIDEIEKVLHADPDLRKIHHIFGEGVSPRLRKARSGMEAVGLPPDKLLKHGSLRIVYGIALAAQFQDVLLGIRANRPRYFFPFDDSQGVTHGIGDFWIKRWLSRRIEQDNVLAAVERHTPVYPVTHGARVELPPVTADEFPLFEFMGKEE